MSLNTYFCCTSKLISGSLEQLRQSGPNDEGAALNQTRSVE